MGHYCNDLDRHAASCWVNTVGLHADMERFRWVLMEKQGHRAECIRPKLIWVHTCHTRKLCRGGSGNQGDAQGLNLQHTYSLLEKNHRLCLSLLHDKSARYTDQKQMQTVDDPSV